MKWHYLTGPDFKWPELGQRVLIYDVNTNIRLTSYYASDTFTVEAWASVELPKKKRWKPKSGDCFWFITEDWSTRRDIWGDYYRENVKRASFGVYKTEEEAEAMFQKIKDFVTKEIGEP